MGKIILTLGILVILLISGCDIPNTPKEELEWCLKHKPQFNSSSMEGIQTDYKIKLGVIKQKCFVEYWSEYCKVSYPNDCPK